MGTEVNISASQSELYFEISNFFLNTVCMLKVHSIENETILKTSHILTYIMGRVENGLKKKIMSISNTCLSFLSCIFWAHLVDEHSFYTVNVEIVFGRFSQNEACF